MYGNADPKNIFVYFLENPFKTIYSRFNGSNAFETMKYVRDKGSCSWWVLIKTPGQEAY